MDDLMNDALKSEIISDLELELSNDQNFNVEILQNKVKNAVREVQNSRKYPTHYTKEQIENDMYSFYSNIRNIALYDYNQIGVEFQQSHNENGTSRSYTDRNKLFSGVIPLAKM